MPDIVLGLGAAVVKAACKIWFADNPFASELSGSVVDVLAGQNAGVRERRRAQRLFEDIEETVADRLLSTLEHEFGGLPENERNAAVLAVTGAFERAQLDDKDLFAADLDALFLERNVRADSPGATRDLEVRAAGLYDRMLAECCAYVIEVSVGLPAFDKGALTEILRRETEILTGIRELLGRIPRVDAADPDAAFLATYQRQVAKALDRLELFGITVSETIRRYPLSVAYISLNVQAANASSFRGGLAVEVLHPFENSTWRVQEVVGASPRLLLRGDAGSGKTTLLQWMAVRCARGDLDDRLDQLAELVPFFIPLRRYVGRDLPAPEEFVGQVGRHIADEMPRGCVQRLLRAGRAMVLIDGIDELPEAQREPARAWLRDLVGCFPDSRYVVTSRPGGVDIDWLDGEDFESAELQPMSWSDVGSFVDHWHRAMAAGQWEGAEGDRLASIGQALLEAINSRRHLRALATNPLLCALLCALHLDRRMQLPQDRMELYAVALEMLLERRDLERRIAGDWPVLSRTDKVLILQDLAYWLIRNGLTDAPCDRAVEQVGQSLAAMPRLSAAPAEVFGHLLNRSGLIREPVAGRVDFVHRTFQEYLAARAAIESDDIGVLVRQADNDQWREVVVMAAGHAQPRQRKELLDGLLGRAAASDAPLRKTLQVLAVACLETCPQLDREVQEEVQQVTRDLLPPRTMTDAAALASAGEFVLDLLADRPPSGIQQTVATIRTAAEIGGEHALRLLAGCAQRDDQRIRSELMRAWPRFDPAEFARVVLRNSPYGRSAHVNDAALMPALTELPCLTTLSYRVAGGYGDLGFTRHLPSLEVLRVIADPALRDISPLRTCESLTKLLLQDVGPVDLTPVADMRTLESLLLSDVRGIDLAPVTRCSWITDLGFGHTAGLRSLLATLPPGPLDRLGLWMSDWLSDLGVLAGDERLAGLRSLDISSGPLAALNGIEAWAETLECLCLYRLEDLGKIDGIRSLHRLRSLELTGTGVRDLGPLRELSELRTVLLRTTEPMPDLSPLSDLPDLDLLVLACDGTADLTRLAGKTGLTVQLERRQKARGTELLGEGSKVVRIW